MKALGSQLLYYVVIFVAIAASLCMFNTMTGQDINWPLNITIALGVTIIWIGLSLLHMRKKAKDAKTERTAIKHMSKAEKRAFKEAEAARYERIKQERKESQLEYEDTVEVTITESRKDKKGKKSKETISWTTSADSLAEAEKLVEKAEAQKVAQSIKNMKPGKADAKKK